VAQQPDEPDLPRAARAVEELLRALGRDPQTEPELSRTGELVAEAYANDLLAGYTMDAAQVLASSTAASASDLVVLRALPTVVVCPHHLLPATGVSHVAYVPGERIAGLGAIARLIDCEGRRLVLQETMTQAVADALVQHLGATAAGCAVELSPLCLCARGERCHGTRVLSIATSGQDQGKTRVHDALIAVVGEAG
jgi:GTP cyclohydrolase I